MTGRGQEERDFLAAYDPRDFAPIAVTVDVVALTLREGRLHVLAVRRGGPPFAGEWALPGGFVRAGQESLDEAAARELAEETGLDAAALGRVHLEQLGSYGRPDRDPRMHVVSVAYLAFAPRLPDATAGGDAAGAEWLPVPAISPAGQPSSAPSRPIGQGRRTGTHGGGTGRRPLPPGPAGTPFAFDHDRVLADGLERARAKIEYTPLATAFLGETFTISDLRAVYEAVWGTPLHAGNFHRKVLSVPGFVESTGETGTRPGSRGGPRARLYRAGDARRLHPALLRPDREADVR
ncbi:NUDIX hydrolase [Actinacidiphila acidipaludis]|uniref:NUDIX domain-containing protein n=1 Tax=Actinacidiphila acidipaludis TaxID=2873382 RepID=A0ABS7QBV4_9ACTN|nr:NUDIX domain-containing protein [Streptomyces acidipaludis]MBY8880657.1 NUDIX domain-containing protein [Streptomyces acidipaludis]